VLYLVEGDLNPAPPSAVSLDATHPDPDPKLANYHLGRPAYSLVLGSPGTPSRWATVEALSVLVAVERARG
jgi:hypothetical protein